MILQRCITRFISWMYHFNSLFHRSFRDWKLIFIGIMTFFLIGLVILLKQTISHSKSHSNSKSFDYHPLLVEKNLEETPSQQQEDHESISLSLSRNETDIESES